MSTTLPPIIVFPRGQLTPEDKATLNAAGVVGIEADDPSQVKQVQLQGPTLASSTITGDAIVHAALAALTSQKPQTEGGLINSLGIAQDVFLRRLQAAIKTPPDEAPKP